MKSKNIYSLPFQKNTIFLAVSDPRAHFAHGKHAIDFAILGVILLLISVSYLSTKIVSTVCEVENKK